MSTDGCVQYERLRPAQIVERRQACPVAYLPIGTMEWHGEHNPIGLDALKSHALLIRCAKAAGGLVFPPLYYGENREQALMEASARDRERIAERMHLPAENFAPGYMREPLGQQNRAYLNLLVHVFHEVRSLGFRVLVVGAGHYPLLDHARAAASLFHQEQDRPKLLVWPMSGYELVRRELPAPCGDHAGKWETSLLMALDDGMQDLSLLPEDRDTAPIGASNNGVQDASPRFGQRGVEAIVAAVRQRVHNLLACWEDGQGHGAPL